MECAPAFNYARDTHETTLEQDDSIPATEGRDSTHKKATFTSEKLTLDLRFVGDSALENVQAPTGRLQLLNLSHKGHKGHGVFMDLDLEEGQVITFVLRTPPDHSHSPVIRPSEERAKELGVPFESKRRRARGLSNVLTIIKNSCVARRLCATPKIPC
jgi:hypothetical protein